MMAGPAHLDRLLSVGRRTSGRLSEVPGVIAIAQGGSAATGRVDEDSDVDLYVYCDEEPTRRTREEAVGDLASPGTGSVDHGYFEGGDVWQDGDTGLAVDVMYRRRSWAEDRIASVFERHEPSLGYSTAILFNIQTCVPLHDEAGWLRQLQDRCNVPYPQALADAIVAHNLPMLRALPFSYRRELDLSARRGDVPAAIHVIDRFLASYFDVLFALNLTPHPGEKRLVELARALPVVPDDFAPQVLRLLAHASSGATLIAAVETMDQLIDELEVLV